MTVRVLNLYGTRPETIKMAPVIRAFQNRSDEVEALTVSTGQHREMVRQVEDVFQLRPDFELDVMRPNQKLPQLTARLLTELSRVTEEVRPDWIIAQGDTTTVLVSAMVAFYEGIRFGHVEAGLRTGNLRHPFPEEFNRLVSDIVADGFYCPTERSADNLRCEGKAEDAIHVTGNTVIDALLHVAEQPYDWADGPLKTVEPDQPTVLITAHRRESFGDTFRGMCRALATLATNFPDTQFIYPVHLNPNVQQPVKEILDKCNNVQLLPPLDYVALVQLMKASRLVITDSGGIQEEAPGLKVPVIVMRETTERPEGVDAGVVRLVGTSESSIVKAAVNLLESQEEREKMRSGINPYGDGHAAARIVSAVLDAS